MINIEHAKRPFIVFATRHPHFGRQESPTRHLFRRLDRAMPQSDPNNAAGNPESVQGDLRVPLCDPPIGRLLTGLPRASEAICRAYQHFACEDSLGTWWTGREQPALCGSLDLVPDDKVQRGLETRESAVHSYLSIGTHGQSSDALHLQGKL